MTVSWDPIPPRALDTEVLRRVPNLFADESFPAPPGKDVVDWLAHALPEDQRKKKEEVLRRVAAYYQLALFSRTATMIVPLRRGRRAGNILPGHLWGMPVQHPYGPTERADVMVVGIYPGEEELRVGRNFMGRGSQPLVRALVELGVPARTYGRFYVTNLIKHLALDPTVSAVPARWVKNCLPLLMAEIYHVRPKVILVLGAEPVKALLGRRRTLQQTEGRVLEYTLPALKKAEAVQTLLVASVHPAAVARSPELHGRLLASVRLALEAASGRARVRSHKDVDHRVVRSEQELAAIVDELIEAGADRFALDCEWHGQSPYVEEAFLRTIQFSWEPGKAVCVVLREVGGKEAFQPSIDAAVRQLRRLFLERDRPIHVGGHFFRADLPWLLQLGLDLRWLYAPPGHRQGVPGWERARRGEGGFDTGLMLHAYREAGEFGLTPVAAELAGTPFYDEQLEAWKREAKPEHRVAEGYGWVPGEILYPYACWDADATMRLYHRLAGTPDRPGLLAADRYGNDCWRAYWQAHRASLAFLEMEMSGVLVDRERADALVDTFQAVYYRMVDEFREEIRWPDFNPRSADHCREFLYGEELNGTFDKATGRPRRLRPDGAVSLRLTPIKATGRRGPEWRRLKDREKELYRPSTDRETLGILGRDQPLVWKLRDIRFLDQVLKTVLRPPSLDEQGDVLRDEDGQRVYESGLLGWICPDGRLHTHFFQTKETGRASSSRPPLQNLSKRREADYERILGSDYEYPIRSILTAPPGWYLVEADLKVAELAALAWEANDPQMIADVERSCLPEDDPDYVDLHAQMAVRAFKLKCKPTKKAMKEAGLIHLRVAAKNVNFGIPYQRGPAAIARQCAEEGVDVSVNDAEELRNAYFERYPRVYDFLEECKRRVVDPGWICGAFGRYRRFYPTEDREVLAAQQREACNFPIQNLVADAIQEALYQIFAYRSLAGMRFRLVLQIHDAILLEVPEDELERVCEEVLPECMSRRVPITPRRLDGEPLPGPPRHFSIDIEVFRHWGVPLHKEK